MTAAMLTAAALFVAPARAQTPTTTAVRPPKAWVLVDADTGAVIAGSNHRVPRPAASLVKILTALAAVDALAPGAAVPVSRRAQDMPARKLNMKAGQVWELEHVLHSLLLSSANDAAVALAERAAGSAERFGTNLIRVAARIGLSDRPQLRDPSGLDDQSAIGGGNLVSARDLAIAARALLADPGLAAIVATPLYEFTGGDGLHHRLTNHNSMLKTYAGAIGVKTGFTEKSGRCLVAAARRGGRTMIAVVLAADDTYGAAQRLLDKGFATPVQAEPVIDVLPELPPLRAVRAAAPSARRPLQQAASDPPQADGGGSGGSMLAGAADVLLAVTAIGGVFGVFWAGLAGRNHWAARRRHRRRPAHMRPGRRHSRRLMAPAAARRRHPTAVTVRPEDIPIDPGDAARFEDLVRSPER